MFNINDVKNKFPLSNDGIVLRLFSEKNITDEYVSWLNDQETVKYSNQRFFSHTKGSSEKYLKSFSNTDNIFISIDDEISGESIGTMTVYTYLMHGTAEVGILIGNKKYLCKGAGRKSWSCLIDFLIKTVCFRKIFAGTLSCNLPMVRVLEGSGMVEDGVFRNHEIVDGKSFDVINYAIYREK